MRGTTTRRASRPRANANRRIIDDATDTRARRENDRRGRRPSRVRFGRAAVVATRAIGDARAGREDAAARDDDDDDDDDDEGAGEFELDFDAREMRARESERGLETMVFESDAEDEYERIAARMEARMEEAFEAASSPPSSARVREHRQYAVQRGVLPASDLHRLLLHAEGEEHSQCVLHKCGHDEDLGDRLSGPQRRVSEA